MDPPALSLFDDLRFDTDQAGSLSVARGTAGFATDDPTWGALALDEASRPSGGPSIVTSDLSIRIHEEDDGSVRGEASIRLHRESGSATDFGDIRAFLQNLASSYAEKGELAGFRVDGLYKSGVEATFSFTGEGLGDSLGGGRRSIRIPSAPGMPADALPEGLSLRRRVRATPIVLPYASAVETVRLRLDLSRMSRVEILPSAERHAGPGILLETKVERNGETILISRHLEITPSGRDRTIGPEEYPAFREVALRRTVPSAGCIVVDRRME
jgi:hypothetical protein